ncbi:MAG TPA: hypothetical protein ENJ84_04150 [Gammaproteobacteria bacterium]|nr:hypothetical protein [Gammaproteobacteria bacterium]
MPRTLSWGVLSAALMISITATSAPVSTLTESLNLSPDLIAILPTGNVSLAELDRGAQQDTSLVQIPPLDGSQVVSIGDADFSFSTGEIIQEQGYQQIIASSQLSTQISRNTITVSVPTANNNVTNAFNDFQGILGFSQNTGQASSISQSIVFQRQ